MVRQDDHAAAGDGRGPWTLAIALLLGIAGSFSAPTARGEFLDYVDVACGQADFWSTTSVPNPTSMSCPEYRVAAPGVYVFAVSIGFTATGVSARPDCCYTGGTVLTLTLPAGWNPTTARKQFTGSSISAISLTPGGKPDSAAAPTLMTQNRPTSIPRLNVPISYMPYASATERVSVRLTARYYLAQMPVQSTSSGAGTTGGGALERDVDRMGSDLYSFPLSADDPTMCQTACGINAQCAAWTYVRAGTKGPQAVCFVKGSAPAPRSDSCCVSGVRSTSATGTAAATSPTAGGAAGGTDVTSPADVGERDPKGFPRIPGLVRTKFTAATFGAETREEASYTSSLSPQDLQKQFAARLQDAGWRLTSRNESGAKATDVLLMYIWSLRTTEMDLRIYGRGPSASEVSVSIVTR